jgi:three-Cys-motif partner protein
MIPELYRGREQSFVKHFILKQYLQSLAFKILLSGHYEEIVYVDGFSGPWEACDPEFNDTSFKIAIDVLLDVQKQVRSTGRRASIKCVLVEKKARKYAQLVEAVESYNAPGEEFSITTMRGRFEDNIPAIMDTIGNSFPLVFIDPTGWNGYAYDQTRALLAHTPGEVIINFMYSFFHRFLDVDNPALETQRKALLGDDWRSQFDAWMESGEMPTREEAITELYRAKLREVGNFKHVVTTKIEKPTEDRAHYFLAYATRHVKGLDTFREIEAKALQLQDSTRRHAKHRKAEEKSGQRTLFDVDEMSQNASHDDFLEAQFDAAKQAVVQTLKRHGACRHRAMKTAILERFTLRPSDVNALMSELAREGVIEATWKLRSSRARVPHDEDMIILMSNT